jgi:hypothetical protein
VNIPAPVPLNAAITHSAAQCHAVLVDFLAAIDRGQATQALGLFTPDACFEARGRAAALGANVAADDR